MNSVLKRLSNRGSNSASNPLYPVRPAPPGNTVPPLVSPVPPGHPFPAATNPGSSLRPIPHHTGGAKKADLSGVDSKDAVWLFLSGGGLSAAFGAIGVVALLDSKWAGRNKVHAWEKTTRIVSVSGGSLANHQFMNTDIRFLGDERRRIFKLFSKWSLWRVSLVTLVSSLLAIAGGVFIWWIWPALGLSSRAGMVGGVLIVLYLIAAMQIIATFYTRARMWHMTRMTPDPGPPRLHIFSTVELRSGLPAYILRHQDDVLVAHDRRSMINQVEFYTADVMRSFEPVFASASWPFFHLPEHHELDRVAGPVVGWTAEGSIEVVARPAPAGDSGRRRFVFLDGGLSGTLGSRIDPSMYTRNPSSLMQLVRHPGEPYETQHRAPKTLRIVMDAGNHPEQTRAWRQSFMPGISAFYTTARSIGLMLNSLVTLDRELTNVPGKAPTGSPDVWHVAVTGAGRNFRVRTRGSGLFTDSLTIGGRPGLFDRVNWRGVRVPTVVLGAPADLQSTLDLLDRLRAEADQISYFPTKQRAMGCVASGAAATFVEAQGIGGIHNELIAFLEELETSLLMRGVIRELIPEAQRPPYRWSELDAVHDRAGLPTGVFGPGPVFAISHQGDTVKGNAKPNTLAAFQSAVKIGIRVLELDVAVTKDTDLLVLHTTFGRLWNSRRPWRVSRPVANMRTTDVASWLGYVPPKIGAVMSNGQILNATGTVTWNIESKTEDDMKRLVAYLQNRPANDVIISGGWRRSVLEIAREANPNAMTAASLGDVLRLILGIVRWKRSTGFVPHVAVLQLDARIWAFWRWPFRLAAGTARSQGIQVHWYGVNTERAMKRIRDAGKNDGISTDKPEILEEVLKR